MIRFLIREVRIRLAYRKLEKLTAKRKRSYEVESYRRHRAAALKGIGKC